MLEMTLKSAGKTLTFADIHGHRVRDLAIVVTDWAVVRDALATADVIRQGFTELFVRSQIHGEPCVRIR